MAKWIAFFSQTGSEIVNISKAIGRVPDLIVTNNDEGGYIPSVQSINRLAIEEASKILPEISLYLVNLTQFYK